MITELSYRTSTQCYLIAISDYDLGIIYEYALV